MKTPMQELIEKVQSLRQIDAVINPIGVIESILSNMLEKEKEVIMDAYDAGLFDGSMDDVDDRLYKDYYNETFKTKLPQDTDGCSNDRSKCSCKNWGGCPVD